MQKDAKRITTCYNYKHLYCYLIVDVRLFVEQNIFRLQYLLDLYNISADDLLSIINLNLKTIVDKDTLFSKHININILKRIDKVFKKGIHFYLDQNEIVKSADKSIFFRKANFNSELNLATKKIVNQFEDLKLYLSSISKLAEISNERILPYYNTNIDPKQIASKLRQMLNPEYHSNSKDFLKGLISKFAEFNILVFEFVETWNKKEKVNIDGFYLYPNFIVLKRQQHSFRREIFTLIHELAHYLINEEEIEQIDYSNLRYSNNIERWCNDFTYYFLVSDYFQDIDSIKQANIHNNYYFELISNISQKTHLSKMALFTKLLLTNKISQSDYLKIKNKFEYNYRLKLEKEQVQKELEKLKGKRFASIPKPINSPLFVSTIQAAMYHGIISEFDFCKTLKINPNKLNIYLQ